MQFIGRLGLFRSRAGRLYPKLARSLYIMCMVVRGAWGDGGQVPLLQQKDAQGDSQTEK